MNRSIPIILVAGLLIVHGVVGPGNVGAQEEEKKVIKTTTDSRGFERNLTEVDLMYQTAHQFIFDHGKVFFHVKFAGV